MAPTRCSTPACCAAGRSPTPKSCAPSGRSRPTGGGGPLVGVVKPRSGGKEEERGEGDERAQIPYRIAPAPT
jgi:hypothetical protein